MHGVLSLLKCFKAIHSTTTPSKHETKPPENELADGSVGDDEDEEDDEDDEDNGNDTFHYDTLRT